LRLVEKPIVFGNKTDCISLICLKIMQFLLSKSRIFGFLRAKMKKNGKKFGAFTINA
jgi:hypothetical protein